MADDGTTGSTRSDDAPGETGVVRRVRVVRVDKGAVSVLPGRAPDRLLPGRAAGPVVDDEGCARTVDQDDGPLRVDLDRDGLVPFADGSRRPAAVGDWLELGELADGALHVRLACDRRTALVRDTAGATSDVQTLAANVDVVLVAEHLDPDPSLGRIERLLTLAWRSGALPVVVLTKSDLVPDPEGMAAEVAGVAIGVDVHAVSAVRGDGLESVRALLRPGVTLVVVGPSGAGKSTLVNALAGSEVMATAERRSDGRGRHTTTHRELVVLPGGAVLIDTPGLRGVGLVADATALGVTFADVEELAARCRFGDCVHGTEPGCAVRAAIESGELAARRLDSWRRLVREAAFQERRADARLAAQDRAQRKRITVEHQRQRSAKT
ncbi:MAG: ribosome small subunit-dependent GTPase A [Cellulomonas sp.]